MHDDSLVARKTIAKPVLNMTTCSAGPVLFCKKSAPCRLDFEKRENRLENVTVWRSGSPAPVGCAQWTRKRRPRRGCGSVGKSTNSPGEASAFPASARELATDHNKLSNLERQRV